jgi:hypothetical protein
LAADEAIGRVIHKVGCQTHGDVRDPETSLVAEKIIEVAQRGVHDPELLRRMALNELGRAQH